MSQTETPASKQTLIFRCPKELDGLIPKPVPAAQGIPGWFKSMPAQAFNGALAQEFETVKRCPPFIDAMTSGFLIPLVCDVKFENGEFTWDNEIPAGGSVSYPRSPIGFHDPGQVTGTPLFDGDKFLLKFHNLWTIEAPEGYSLFFTHPVNRFDLPFTTLSGMVDCDRFTDAWIHFPARWQDMNFSGVLPKGTPIAQIFAVKRDQWSVETGTFDEAKAQAVHDLTNEIDRDRGVYRKQFRA